MAKNTDIKSAAFAEKHDLDSKVVVTDKGLIELPADLHESIVLADAGVTLDQFKKIQKGSAELFAGVTYVAAPKIVNHMKANPEVTEMGFSYAVGGDTTASAIFNRDGIHVVNAVETKIQTAEMKRVHSYIDDLFNNINN